MKYAVYLACLLLHFVRFASEVCVFGGGRLELSVYLNEVDLVSKTSKALGTV